jgi:uncharacterized protein YbbK (DUF523 family)
MDVTFRLIDLRLMTSQTVRIGISSCLLGQKVRFDGGHKRDAFLADTFGAHVEWVPVCPEVEVGMGTPREPIRLVRHGAGVRLLGVKSATDHTNAMREWAARRAEALAREDLDGYVLKKDSPSCGMERVKVYDPNGAPVRTGRGLFAEALMERLPLLPVEEEGRLSDPRLRENFVERVFAHRRLTTLFAGRWTVGALVRFHGAHKLTLLAHSPSAYQSLGRLVARAASIARLELRTRYEEGFMRALGMMATPRRLHTPDPANFQRKDNRPRTNADGDAAGACGGDHRLRRGPGAPHRPGHAAAPPRSALRHRLSRLSGLSGAPPEGADAAKPRVIC